MKTTLLSVVPACILLISSALNAEQDPINQRISDLENRVAELELLVNELSGKNRWKDPILWQRVKKEMSSVDIKKLLGKPTHVEKQIFETWYYHPTSRIHSYVWFDESMVLGWKVPDL